MTPRPLAFVVVGAAGFVVQATLLMLLTARWQWPLIPATALAVEAAILVNFLWHERWTWADRDNAALDRAQRLLRFHAANGLLSLAGSVGITWTTAHYFGLPPLVANALSVAIVAAVNYQAADRWVFRAALVAGCLATLPATSSAAEPKSETLAAWIARIAAVEQSLDHEAKPPMALEPHGQTVDVPGGTISEWRGTIVIPAQSVTQVVDALVQSTTLPAPKEVVEARVLSRNGDSLHTYMKLRRHTVVTVTYDTEHDVRYVRYSPALATSRSIATRIAEADGGDRGFMWRLNSYWRYEQVGGDVRIDVRTLTLSRNVPWLLRPIAMPMVERIGRESMRSTLAAVARFLEMARESAPLVSRVQARAR